MEGDNRPLALNAWDVSGPNSHKAAIDAVDAVINPEEDQFFRDNPELTNFVLLSLYDRITSQSQANFVQYQKLAQVVDLEKQPEMNAFVQGQKSPSELTLFMYLRDELESIEIGRRTLRRVWDTKATVDGPIRSDLDNSPFLQTQKRKSPPVYRIKNLNLNVDDTSDEHFVQIDRKRTVREHLGGQVLTVVRNSVVLHNTDPHDKLPRDIRKLIQEERRRAKQERGYNYDEHSDEMHAHLEHHIRNRNEAEKPAWMTPILTTYYSVMEHAVKEERLKEIEEAA